MQPGTYYGTDEFPGEAGETSPSSGPAREYSYRVLFFYSSSCLRLVERSHRGSELPKSRIFRAALYNSFAVKYQLEIKPREGLGPSLAAFETATRIIRVLLCCGILSSARFEPHLMSHFQCLRKLSLNRVDAAFPCWAYQVSRWCYYELHFVLALIPITNVPRSVSRMGTNMNPSWQTDPYDSLDSFTSLPQWAQIEVTANKRAALEKNLPSMASIDSRQKT